MKQIEEEKEMKELKMGNIVEVKGLLDNSTWKKALFVKQGASGGVVVVQDGHEDNFAEGVKFETHWYPCNKWREYKEPKYRPFTWEERDQLRWKWIKRKDKDFTEEKMIVSVNKNALDELWVATLHEDISIENLFDVWEFINGSPCGVME